MTREVCLSYLPDIQVGQYVIVHVGFAISMVDEEEAQRTLEVLTAMGDLVQAELTADVPDVASPEPVTGPVTAL